MLRNTRQLFSLVKLANKVIINNKSLITSTFTVYKYSNLIKNNYNYNSLINYHSKFSFASYPSHQKLGMPALSPTMEKGNVAKWVKKEGDHILPGEVICEIETDKATVGYENIDEGYLAKIIIQEGGKDVKVGQLMAIIVEEKDDVAAFKDYKEEGTDGGSASPASPATQQPKQESQQQTIQQTNQVQQNQQQGDDRIFISPLARKFALQNGLTIDLLRGKGTGPNGRVTRSDVNKAISESKTHQQPPQQQAQQQVTQKQQQTEAPKQTQPQVQAKPQFSESGNQFVDTPVTQIRKVIADRLLESKTTIPHYYLTISVEMSQLLNLRTVLNKETQQKISVNDFIVKASSLACRDVPECNSSWLNDKIRTYKNCDVSVAVQTDVGLITPIVFAANAKGLKEISQNVKELADKAKQNKLKPQEFIGGTFCVSNLGMFGIDQFAAVINPPQSCILAVGKTDKKAVPSDDKEHPVKFVDVMNVTLSCDHRVVDGAVGAKWLNQFKYYMENPSRMIL